MPTVKATSKSGEDGKVDTATSGPNAKASAKSKDKNGEEWVSKSNSKTDENVNTIVEKIFGQKTGNDDEDDDSASSWTLLGSKSSKDTSSEADASTGKDGKAKASSGKASAGIVDGKAVATAG